MKAIENLFARYEDLLLAIARIGFGGMMAYHGYPKLMNMAGFIGNMEKMGFFLPVVMGPLAMAAELFGGILVAVGFKTRIASTFIFVTMLVAALVVHAADPFQKKELALLYALMSLVFMAKGSGKIAVGKD